MKKFFTKIFTAIFALSIFIVPMQNAEAVASTTRIKDIAKVQGVRSNQLLGYGLVVGLNGTGDSDDTIQMIRSTISLLKEFGITVAESDIDIDNTAAVIVTATLPPFVREGDTIDVTISSMGDASSIQGGTLLHTPLRAADGEVYALAQGAVSTGGFAAGGGGGGGNNRATRNFPTVGMCPNGAIVERTVEDDDIGSDGRISLSLMQSDFTTATRVASAINARFGAIARPANPGRIDIRIPNYYRGNVVAFIAGVEELMVTPDNVAKVVMNERTGTIVMGGDVSVDECAITQGGLTIRVRRDENAFMPAPYSYGSSLTTESTEIEVEEEMGNTVILPATASISDIVGALNAVGATPRDTISILQAMKAAGAIHAEIQII